MARAKKPKPQTVVVVIDGNAELGGALGSMLEIISRIGGFMSAEDQARIRTAREVYAAHGRR